MIGEGLTKDNIDSKLYGSLREKRDELLKACDGVLTKVQKRLIRAVLDHIDDTTRRITEIDDIVNDQVQEYEEARKKLEEMPGIGGRSAQVILAEIGSII